ncbi:MAG: class I mannose-6-phosphate isomerase [Candidatus Carbobacillus altaicus]|nr:class I mannose-6-phosphate isomerase [Candidatus Carbobacillus altaicus]
MLQPTVPLRFVPRLVGRVWGGHALQKFFPKADREGLDRDTIGEVWTLVDHPSYASRVADGPWKDATLRELMREHAETLIGYPADRFPLLIKWIEAQADLSVQIHPDDAYAREHEGDLGKSEAWYIVQAPPSKRVIAGDTFPSAHVYWEAIKKGELKAYLKHTTIEEGELIYIPSRTVHALLAGSVVIEVQQPSNVTYRIYDWDRIDPVTGKPRTLHLEKAADVIPFGEPSRVQIERSVIDTPYFRLEKVILRPDETLRRSPHTENRAHVLIVAEGDGVLRAETANEMAGDMIIQRGDTILLPYALKTYQVKATAPLTLVLAMTPSS